MNYNYNNTINESKPIVLDSKKVNIGSVNYSKEELIELKRALEVFSEVCPELSDNRGYSPVQPLGHSTR